MTDDQTSPPPLTPPQSPPPTPPAPTAAPTAAAPLSSTCPSCGSQTAYAPGTTALRCGSCGSELAIDSADLAIEEHSYDEWRARSGTIEVASIGAYVLRCQGCGATTETVDLAGTCQFCNGALIADEQPEGLVSPEAVVPFGLDKRRAQSQFAEWVSSRRFAPNALKKVGSAEQLAGTYVPHWTFDADTSTAYTGQRGDYYYVTVTRQVPDGKGGTTSQSSQERRTRWRAASGQVARTFDDVVSVGTHRVEPKKLAKMGPWTLPDARPFQQEYLTGYSALRYDIDPQEGAKDARQQMRGVIQGDCAHDIGGDEQRVSSMDVTYANATFKLLLLPLWVATYLYAGKTWQVFVNANTGEVVGERPWSVVKIVAAVLAALVLIAVIVGVILATGGSGSGSG